MDTLALEPMTPSLTAGRRSTEDPNEILLDDDEAASLEGDDFEAILDAEKGDEEIEEDE